MFDIGFAELVIIGVVALLVIGPERLPGAVRTASLWINRIRRGFNEIKAEVQQELHNDSVMQELKKTGEQLKDDTQAITRDVRDSAEKLTEPVADLTETIAPAAESKAPAADNMAPAAEKKAGE